MGNGAIVGIVVVAAVVVVLGGVGYGWVSARRARRGPAVPDPDTRATTVAGRPATVRTPAFVERQWLGMQNGGWSRPGGIVEIRVHGPVAADAFTVLPRHRPEEDLQTPGLPPAVSAFVDSTLRAAAVRGTTEAPTGDAASGIRV